MSLRHKAREYALQMLFEWEVGRQPPARIKTSFWKNARAAESTRSFANQLFEGTAADSTALDELIGRCSEHWRLDRMAAIDRAILRLAAHELEASETPVNVIINEAVELAKTFSSAESAPFINGILDSISKARRK